MGTVSSYRAQVRQAAAGLSDAEIAVLKVADNWTRRNADVDASIVADLAARELISLNPRTPNGYLISSFGESVLGAVR